MSPLASVVIIGRPNVGKSLLFNKLLGKRAAIVHGKPGMTLDFLRERLALDDGAAAGDYDDNAREVWLTDTGGVAGEADEWQTQIEQQMRHAAQSASLFLLVVDYTTGLLAGDAEIARRLRQWRHDAPCWLVVNKSEGAPGIANAAEFYALGISELLMVSAKHGKGIGELRERLSRHFAEAAGEDAGDIAADEKDNAADDNDDNAAQESSQQSKESQQQLTTAVVVGRANVGKSTFINRLLGDTRLVVSERPGTTRDTVSCELAHKDGALLLMDTAGMRRRRATPERERLGVAGAKRALTRADCAILMIDISEGLTYQDKRILSLIQESGAAVMVVANKADAIAANQRAAALAALRAALPVRAAPVFIVSALSSRPLPTARLLAAARAVAREAHIEFPTGQLNAALEEIVAASPPRQRGKVRPKLRYAHQGGKRPPAIIIHGSATDRIDAAYRRYLSAAFARRFALTGNVVKIILRSEQNPYHQKT